MSPTPRAILRHFLHRTEALPEKFQRHRRWSPRSVMLALMVLTQPRKRMNYPMTLDTLMAKTGTWLKWDKAPTMSSLSMARAKVPIAQCREFLQKLVHELGEAMPRRVRPWTTRRIVGVDGTRLITPRSPETLQAFTRPKQSAWLHSHYPQAMVVVAYDVMRRLPLDWAMVPKGSGERAGLEALLPCFRAGDIAVMDRGYPSHDLLNLLVRRGVDVVMRMGVGKRGVWSEVKDFVASGSSSAVVEITCGEDDHGRPLRVPVRMILRKPPRGRPLKHQHRETMVVLTTLLPKDGFESADILSIYQSRWGVETLFREMKVEFDIEQFHSQSILGIEQEIAAVLMWVALSSAIEFAAEDGLEPGSKVQRTMCMYLGRSIVETMMEGGDVDARIASAMESARRTVYKERPGRSFPRERKMPYGRFNSHD
jgi:hypothetical protein